VLLRSPCGPLKKLLQNEFESRKKVDKSGQVGIFNKPILRFANANGFFAAISIMADI
jgi:hypothetical protein